MQKEKQSVGRGGRYVQPTRDHAEHGRQVATGRLRRVGETERSELGQGKNAFGRREESAALGAAGAVGNMVEGETLAQKIELDEPGRIGVGRGHEWKRASAKLAQACLEKALQIRAISQFTMMPGSFKSA